MQHDHPHHDTLLDRLSEDAHNDDDDAHDDDDDCRVTEMRSMAVTVIGGED